MTTYPVIVSFDALAAHFETTSLYRDDDVASLICDGETLAQRITQFFSDAPAAFVSAVARLGLSCRDDTIMIFDAATLSRVREFETDLDLDELATIGTDGFFTKYGMPLDTHFSDSVYDACDMYPLLDALELFTA